MMEHYISVPKLFASRDVTEWFQRYDICCRVNEWNSETMALTLPMLLEGEALAV